MEDTSTYDAFQTIERTRPRVLVVDDDPDTRASLADLFEYLDYEVLLASTGGEALAAYDANRPDLVFLDIGLPDITGHELAEQLRRRSRQVRLIALSGWSQPNVVNQSFAVGIDMHVVKPLGIDGLKKILSDADDEPARWAEGSRIWNLSRAPRLH